MSGLAIATDLVQRLRCSVVPIPHKRKGPTIAAWDKLRLNDVAKLPKYFNGSPQNIGIHLGEPSAWLVDVDLDQQKAVELAGQYLPPTGSKFGRASKRSSHYLYRLKGPGKLAQFRDADGEMIVELRCSYINELGALKSFQTVAPGSIHETTGEAIEWESDGEPAEIEPDALLTAVKALAEAVCPGSSDPKPPAKLYLPTEPYRPATDKDEQRAERYLEALAVKRPAIQERGGHPSLMWACRYPSIVGNGCARSEAWEVGGA